MIMMGLFSTEQVAKACKHVNTAISVNPILTMQEQLLISRHFWVVSKQPSQQPIDPEAFTMIIAFNQAQVMHQQLARKFCHGCRCMSLCI
jgi:hypothetical protein